MWPEILACEPRRGWKSDKLLPPAVGSFSATQALRQQGSKSAPIVHITGQKEQPESTGEARVIRCFCKGLHPRVRCGSM